MTDTNGQPVKLLPLEIVPNGAFGSKQIVRHTGAVGMVPLAENGDVFLIRQYRIAVGDMQIEIPAGGMEPGEDPLTCAVRELQEEIGYKPGKLELIGCGHAAPGYSAELMHIFLATDLTPSKLAEDEDESIEVLRVPFAEALRMVEQGTIQNLTAINGLLLVARRWGV